MIIDATTIAVTLIFIAIGAYIGLHLIRQFALSIAIENHEANVAIDSVEEAQRKKRAAAADAAAASAFAKVEPLLPSNTKGSSSNSEVKQEMDVDEEKQSLQTESV